MLLTDVEDNYVSSPKTSITICGFKKSVVFTNHSRINCSANDARLTIRNLTYTTDYTAGDMYGVINVGGGAALTIENVRFTNCNLHSPSGDSARSVLIRAAGSGSLAEFHAKNLSIDNSTVYSFILYRGNTYIGTIEDIVCGDNCEFVGWSGGELVTGGLISLGYSGTYSLQKLSNITLNDCNINLNGYQPVANTYADHIYGNGTIALSQHNFVTILSDIDMVGTIICQKAHGINGVIRGEITITDTYRTAADGNVFFEGYDSYQITQEDFASMAWGGADGFHLSLENNQILLRADAA